MGDEGGFDPCECIWGHEMAMRRLLSLLRQSQAYCTDTECFQNVTGPQNQNLDNCFLFMILTFIFAVVMFYFRPRSQRNTLLEDVSKPSNNNDANGTPPSPPPTAS
ncbi:hypothetical protein ILUMI_25870 [Ignelater luminosus]|uniref:Small integral membrane protein 14 n=1 Tax=Ignelater luminosus TaxID=2038154 RepID=A0A8K0C9N3_IGNLU|nr:hypothetical protein ILUMI_25870 [Ignelater luminosus]